MITVGNIGGVCTNPDYRGKGYADVLVKRTMEQMENENVALCLISGDRSLYLRNGAHFAGNKYYFTYKNSAHAEGVSYLEGAELEKAARTVSRIYNRENVRFLRPFEFTKTMLRAHSRPLHRYACGIYFSEEAYVIVSFSTEDEKAGLSLVEYAGSADDIETLLGEIVYRTRKEVSGYVCSFHTELLRRLNLREKSLNVGTYKIINASLLFEQLRYRFRRFSMENVAARRDGGGYAISADGKVFRINEEDVHTLVFGSDREYDPDSLFEGGICPANLKAAFPLPIPKYDGLNHI